MIGVLLACLLFPASIAGLQFHPGGVLLLGAQFGIGTTGHDPATGGRLCLATDLPTTGHWAWRGQAMEDAVTLATQQNQSLGHGYTLTVSAYNEASALTALPDQATGAQNVEQMVQTPCVMGLVGPFSSEIARAEMPVAATAGLAMISPSNTDPGLTLRPYAVLEGEDFALLHPAGKPPTYFRIAPTDVAQATVDASLLFEYLGARRIYVVNDAHPYGAALASFTAEQFQVRGGQIVGSESFAPGERSSIGPVAAHIVATHPDAVFYGGITATGGGLLKAQLDRLGYTGPFVGGDGIANDPAFAQQAGTNTANGALASVAASDPSLFTSSAAAQFVHDFHAHFPEQKLDGYGVNAYTAAMVLIAALKEVIQAGQAVTRAAVRDRAQRIHYVGLSGPISFDENGDIASGVFSIYQVRQGVWVYVQRLSV
jgi:branched-chain amino acid transport system substrate-binding protein